jgi:hypothetical protein
MNMAKGSRSHALATVGVLTWMLVLPDIAAAQRAVPRGGQAPGGTSAGDAAPPASRGSARPRVAPDRDEGERTVAPSQPADRGQSDSAQRDAQVPAGDSTADADANNQAQPNTRPRGDNPRVGTAVPRRTDTPPSGGNVIVVPGGSYGGYYPWGYGGLGFGGYYDPWYGGYASYYGYPPQYYDHARRDDGAVRLKVKPREASVYVDGYYVGRVDDFDGIFQRLPLEPGPHRLEIRADDYQSLSVDIRILPDRTITYTGELEPNP